MNDQQQPQAPAAGSGAPSPAPDPESKRRGPAEAPKFEAPKGNPESGRFAAYDTTLGKYVGGVHDTEAKARKAGKDAESSFKVVEV